MRMKKIILWIITLITFLFIWISQSYAIMPWVYEINNTSYIIDYQIWNIKIYKDWVLYKNKSHTNFKWNIHQIVASNIWTISYIQNEYWAYIVDWAAQSNKTPSFDFYYDTQNKIAYFPRRDTTCSSYGWVWFPWVWNCNRDPVWTLMNSENTTYIFIDWELYTIWWKNYIESKSWCYLQKEIVELEYIYNSFYDSWSIIDTDNYSTFDFYSDWTWDNDYHIEIKWADNISYSWSTNSFNIENDLLSFNDIEITVVSQKEFNYYKLSHNNLNLTDESFVTFHPKEWKDIQNLNKFWKERIFTETKYDEIKNIDNESYWVYHTRFVLKNKDYENLKIEIWTVNQVYNEIEVCYEYDEVNWTFNEYINSWWIDLDKEIEFYNDDINKLYLEIKKYTTSMLNLFTFSVDPDYKHYLTIFKPDNTKVKIEQIELNMKPDLYWNPDIDISLKREVVDWIEKIYLWENVIFERELTDFRIFLNYFLPTVWALLYYIFYIWFIGLVLLPVWLYRKFLVWAVNLLFPADIITKTHSTWWNIYSIIPFIIYTVSFYWIAIFLMANILKWIAPVAYNIRNFIAHLFDLLLSLWWFDWITIFTIINTVNLSLWATIIWYIIYLLTLKYGKIT